MTPAIAAALSFVAASLFILWSGTKLARYGDVIASRTGLGATWTGLVVVAAVTSLPELITGASSVLVYDVPDVAAGDAIGSCMFNLLILSFLDFRHPAPLSASIHRGHVLSAAFGLLLFGLAALALLAGPHAPAIGWVGVHSLIFIGVYLFATHTIFVFERSRVRELAEEVGGTPRSDVPLRTAVIRYAGASLVLVAAAAYLPGAAAGLAAATGMGESFVGSLFVAASTSMPEMVVSVAAARMGALDLAAANLFGSNLFNIGVLGVDDLLFTRGPLLQAVEPIHLISLACATTMTAITVIALTYRAQRKRFRLSYDALAILAVYVFGVLLLWRMS
jgi:cation:H+ antiporter